MNRNKTKLDQRSSSLIVVVVKEGKAEAPMERHEMKGNNME